MIFADFQIIAEFDRHPGTYAVYYGGSDEPLFVGVNEHHHVLTLDANPDNRHWFNDEREATLCLERAFRNEEL